MTKVLSQLELNGYITKVVNSDDRRIFNIFPTDKAIAIYPKILEIVAEWHSKMTENLSDIERDVFEKFRTGTNALCGSPYETEKIVR